MVGGIALEACLNEPAVEQVTAIGRRSTGVDHPKLCEITHADFSDCTALHDSLADVDAALFCLGVYSGALPDDQFRTITVDYALRFGEALHAASPEATLCFLSGQGADTAETSRVAFARYKGIAENGLQAMGLGAVHVFRPGYIYPVSPRDEPNFGYRMMRAVYPAIRMVYANAGISSVDLGRAMAHAAVHGRQGPAILENRDIQAFADGL